MIKKILLNSVASAVVLTATAKGEEWKSSFDLGATLTKGNSDSLLVTAGVTSELKEQADEYLLAMFYTYGKDNSTTTNDEILATASWRHLYSDRFYAGPRFDFRKDDLADIGYRAALTATAGYYVVKNATTSLALEGGVGYTFEKQGGLKDDYAHGYVGEFFEHKLNEKTKFYQSLTLFAPVDKLDNYQFVAEVGVETTLTDTLSLKIYAQDKYDAQPASGSDENDFKLVTGISYKF